MSDFNAKKLLRKVWARADADGSGELDADELKLVLQAMGQKNPECARMQQRAPVAGCWHTSLTAAVAAAAWRPSWRRSIQTVRRLPHLDRRGAAAAPPPSHLGLRARA